MSSGELVTKESTDVIHPVAQQQMQYMNLIQMAVEKGSDIVQLEKLMDLQERYENRIAKKEFDSAMSKFQSLIPTIEKKGVVDFTSAKGRTYYEYAKIEDIAHSIKPALKETGISYRFTQKQDAGWITVRCIVTHEGGHSEQTDLQSQPDISGGKDALKATASAITYLRRYTLTGILGIIVGGEDDDGGTIEMESTPVESGINYYPDEDFKGNIEIWSNLILSGAKNANDVIGVINKKGFTLTDSQLNQINKVGN